MFEKLKNAIALAVAEAGLREYEIYYSTESNTSVGTLNKEVNSFSSGVHGGICLRVPVDGRMGYASTELLTEEEMGELARRAIENARSVDKPDTVGIFAGSESYEAPRATDFAPLGAGELRALATDIADTLYAGSDKIQPGTSSQAISASFTVRIANSHGLDLSNTVGVNALVAEAVVQDKGESQADYTLRSYEVGKGDTVAEMSREAIDKAMDKIGADLVPSGKYNVVFSGDQMRSILAVFSSAFSAKQVLDGLSLLKGKLGESIASPIVNITDDPWREGLGVGTTFDAEGVATHRFSVVEGGVLKTYLHNRETALAMNTVTTANASKAGYSSSIAVSPHSFCIEPGEYSLEDLLAKAGDGLYVTEIKGLHAGANPITGDFSLESAGFLIKDGKKCGAVKSFTVAGNFFALLGQISAIGNKLELGVPTGFTGFGAPDVLVPDMSVAGK